MRYLSCAGILLALVADISWADGTRQPSHGADRTAGRTVDDADELQQFEALERLAARIVEEEIERRAREKALRRFAEQGRKLSRNERMSPADRYGWCVTRTVNGRVVDRWVSSDRDLLTLAVLRPVECWEARRRAIAHSQ